MIIWRQVHGASVGAQGAGWIGETRVCMDDFSTALESEARPRPRLPAPAAAPVPSH